MKHKKITIILLMLITVLFGNYSYASMLDDFETSVSKERTHSGPVRSADNCTLSKRCEDSDGFFEGIFNAIFSGFFDTVISELFNTLISEGAKTTIDRTAGYKRNKTIDTRKIGSPLLPKFRLDINRQKLSSNLYGNDIRVELGDSIAGVQIRATKFVESNPSDSLSYITAHGLYRLSFGNRINLNLGIGATLLSGNKKTSGLSLTFPFYWHFHNNIGVEYKPVITTFKSTVIVEQDLSILFNYNPAAFVIGYRKLSTKEEKLSGPYVGFSLRH